MSTNIAVPEHCHIRSKEHGIDKTARNKLLIASGLCLIFMIAEIVGGVLSNSLAIASDAAHLLTDLTSFMISLLALWLAAKPSTKRYSFGYWRAEIIGALISIVMIWFITAILVWLAVQRIINQAYDVEATTMLITSGFAIVVNLIMGCQLGHGHSHGSSHSHNHSNNDDKKEHNINVRAAFIHVIGDLLQSIGVFVAALIIFFKPEWAIADPICTFIFSIIVLYTTFNILKDAVVVLMEGNPRNHMYSKIKDILKDVPGVQKIHNLRLWSLTSNKSNLTVHLAVSPDCDHRMVLSDTRKLLSTVDLFEVTIQIEETTSDMDNCIHCKIPE